MVILGFALVVDDQEIKKRREKAREKTNKFLIQDSSAF